MKKIYILVFSFIFLLCGVGTFSPILFNGSAEEKLHKTISSAEEFVSVMSEVENYNNSNVVITLENDIDLGGQELSYLSSINAENLTFKGIFDGKGWTISNISFVGDAGISYFGLIPYAYNAEIKNVRISGKVEYQFSELNSKELFAGMLVGFGRNVKFENCELDNSSDQDNNEISLAVYSNLNYGALAGQVINDLPISGNVNISNCVNYYDVSVDLKNNSTVFAGGFVGNIKDGYFHNNINIGKFTIANSSNFIDAENVFIGGIAGGVYGSNTVIKNNIFNGQIINNDSSLKINSGAVIGGVTGNIEKSNINFCYYSDFNLKLSGDKTLAAGEYLKAVANINKDFITDGTNFDPALKMWDFDQIFMQMSSGFHLQSFQIFNFSFQQLLDNSLCIESARFVTDEEDIRLAARFGEEVKIKINLKNQYYGFYQLTRVYRNSNQLTAPYTIEAIENEAHQVSGYYVSFKANDMTSGAYSFSVDAKVFKCMVSISNEAKENSQGGILVDSGSTPQENVELPFSINIKEKKVVAKENEPFVFERWELFVKDNNGQFNQMVLFDNDQDSSLVISFGQAPFDREFKLVAYFSKNAVKVDFGQYNTNMVKSITFGGKLYEGVPIEVSPTSSPSLVVVVGKDYAIDIDAFTRDIKAIYGNNSTQTLITSQPEKNEEDGSTTYRFSINLRYVQEFDNGSLKLSFMIKKDGGNGLNNLLWLYITLPIVVVVAAVVVIIIILRKRRNSGSKGDGQAKVKEKKVSYKDFY